MERNREKTRRSRQKAAMEKNKNRENLMDNSGVTLTSVDSSGVNEESRLVNII